MAALALRKSTWDGGSANLRAIFRTLGGYYLGLGSPATYTDGTNEWYVFDDTRFEVRPLCYFACLAANVGSIPAGYQVDESNPRKTRDDAMFWLESPARTTPLVLPGAIAYPDPDPNPWQTILDANGAPAWLKMADSVPANWTVVEAD